jgi:hypothetical protein
MAKRSTSTLQKVTTGLPIELLKSIEEMAEREVRTVSDQIRFLLTQALRSQNGAPTLTPWPPAMVMPKSLAEARAELAKGSKRFDELLALQRRGGHGGTGLLPDEDLEFRFLRDHVPNLQKYVDAQEKMESTS